MEVGGQHHALAGVPPGYRQGAGWDPGPVWTVEESLAPIGIRSLDHPARSAMQGSRNLT